MKKGWKYDKLINIYNFIDYRGATPTKLSEGVPLITAKNVKYGYLDYTIKDFISEDEYSLRQSRGISHKGDLLFTTEAPLGNVAIADLDRYSAGQRLITFQKYCKSKYELENKFYFFYMLSPIFQAKIKSLATGATAQGIKAKILKEIPIPIPPLSEQKEIVEYLDSSFAKIDKLKENAAKNLEEAKALFQSALKDALEPKEGWEEKTLGELGSLKNGMNFTKNESGAELHILGVGDFGNLFSISNTENLPIISLNEIPSDDYMLENEDIVFVRSNGNKNLVGRCLLVYPGNIKTSFSGFCIRFRKNSDKVDAKYLAYFLKAPNTRKKIAGNGANISNLNQKVLQSLAIPFPSLPEQQSIVSFLDSLNEKVNTLQQNYSRICDECDALKQAILRQVFE